MTLFGEAGRIGVEETDGGGGAFGGEVAGLVNEFLGEVEGGDGLVALVPEAKGDTARTAAGFEQRGVFVGEEALD